MKYNYIRTIQGILFLSFVLCLGCNRPSKSEYRKALLLITDSLDIYYALDQADERFFLPYSLSEISGLTFKQPYSLLAIQDEDGILFEYDLKKKEVIHEIRFASANDFEGLELIGDTVWILRSDGDLFVFLYTENETVDAYKLENELNQKNDTEGLGYDPIENQLLIACKASGDLRKHEVKGKAVYGVDVRSGQLNEDPFFVISNKNLEDFMEQNRPFDYEKDRIHFHPSGIAFNPMDGLFYVIASTGKLMVVLNREGKIKGTYPLNARLLKQPEGICFSSEGDLYISSEGDGDRGYVMKFIPKRK